MLRVSMCTYTRYCHRKTRPWLSSFSRINRSLTIVKEKCFSGTHKKQSSCTKHLPLQSVLPQFQSPYYKQATWTQLQINKMYILLIFHITGRLRNYLFYQFQPLQGTCNFFYMNSTIQRTSIWCNDTFGFLT